jgi:hypothetical protein
VWVIAESGSGSERLGTCDVRSSAAIPNDNPQRRLVIAQPDDENLPHLGIVGDTYTILLTGQDTGGRYTLIDMHVPAGGGPPPTVTTSKRCSPSWRVRWT